MSRADKILAIAVILCAVLIVPAVRAASALVPAASMVAIEGPAGRTEVPLGSDRTLTISGASGPVVVVVHDGCARVTESSCPDHVCVRSGSISRAGEAIVCVPNAVTVRIGGERSDGLDAVAR